jgi:hypothetical protein
VNVCRCVLFRTNVRLHFLFPVLNMVLAVIFSVYDDKHRELRNTTTPVEEEANLSPRSSSISVKGMATSSGKVV